MVIKAEIKDYLRYKTHESTSVGQTVPHVGVGVAFLCLYHRRVERFAQSKQLVFLSTHTQKKKSLSTTVIVSLHSGVFTPAAPSVSWNYLSLCPTSRIVRNCSSVWTGSNSPSCLVSVILKQLFTPMLQMHAILKTQYRGQWKLAVLLANN